MELLDATQITANAAKLCNAQLISDYSSSNKIEKIAEKLQIQPLVHDYDASVSSAIGAMLSGKRSITFGSLKGVKKLALLRLPGVIINTSRPPVNYSINLMPESSQELIDDIFCAMKLCENSKVSLPVSIHVDFLLQNTKETVELPSQKTLENFLGRPETSEKNVKLEMDDNLESIALIQKSMENAKTILPEINDQYKKRFKRTLVPFETFMMDDAEFAIIVAGSNSGNAKIAVEKLRKQGEKVGMLRIHMLRPFPFENISLAHLKRIAVIDNQFFVGSYGMLYQEIKSLFYGFCKNYIAGDMISVNDFIQIYQNLKSAEKTERVWMI